MARMAASIDECVPLVVASADPELLTAVELAAGVVALVNSVGTND